MESIIVKAQKKLLILISLLILLAGVNACDRRVPQENTGVPVVTKTEPDITTLMGSMEMQHMSEPVTSPDFILPSLDGEQVSLKAFRGKVVLLSFWATW